MCRAPVALRKGLQAEERVNDNSFPATVYSAAPRSKRPQPTLADRALAWVPMRDLLATRFGFTGRFDRLVEKLRAHGSAALPATQARFFFGDQLLLDIHPRAIEQQLQEYVMERDVAHWIGDYFLDGGEWGAVLKPVAASSSHAEIVEIYHMRRSFREGERYRLYAERITGGRPLRRNHATIDTIDKLDAYFEYYLALVEDIERNGIVPFARLGMLGHTGRAHRWARSVWQDLAERDIGVAIAADGSLVRHTAGKHRMAAALMIGLERIPVEVRMVHVRWLAAQMERFGLPAAEALVAGLEEARTTGRFLAPAQADQPGP